MACSETLGKFILIRIGDDWRIALHPAHFAQLGIITQQVRDIMCKRKRLCSKQDAEQQQPYYIAD